MRKPRPEDFDPDYKKIDSTREPESVDLSGIIPIKEKPQLKKIYKRPENRTEIRT